MSRSGKIRAFFGEGDFDFLLPIDALIELEDLNAPRIAALGFPLSECSVEKMMRRCLSGSARIDELRHVLRLGLIGGDNGLSKMQAADLVERHLQPGDLLECAKIAGGVLAAALIGAPEDDPLGKAPGRAKPPAKRASPMAASAGRSSTAKAPRSASMRGKPAK